ncbi:DUF4123 domain-containing protein [Massilia atriviolacea]|uniref:DUF4123 domain-containing protein n=1 Tax=Massilia atriviolacea TaxID=2495579 RepID=A0A430HNY4_9BURK|nr:DUF4123 domain-containing protein [Massilia atriviolacea]RSZ59184.1 DUF4123 domain-containing protein [Massilia atriviolacea]
MAADPHRAILRRQLGQRADTLYALYDAASDRSLLDELRRDGIAHDCLFGGVKATTLADVAPYLIACRQFAGGIDSFLDKVWGRGVSMLIDSAAAPEQLRMQLKKNAFVKNSAGAECYFRYYDARAFSRFVRAATNEQLGQLCGSAVRAIVWQDSFSQGLASMAHKPSGLVKRILAPDTADFEITPLS